MSKKTNEIIRRIQIKEEKLERKLTTKEKRKIEKSVIREYRRKNIIKGIFSTLGIITIGAGAHALLTDGSEHQQDNKTELEMEIENQEEVTNTFKEELKVDIDAITQEQNEENEVDYDKIMAEILDEYNEKYDIELTEEDISYIKSNPQFLGITDDGTYIQDYKQNTPVQEYIDDGIKDIYVMINNNDNTIISSLGKVDGKITNIDTKVVMDGQRNEYFESDKKIDLTEDKNQEEIEQIYETIENEYEKELEEERE